MIIVGDENGQQAWRIQKLVYLRGGLRGMRPRRIGLWIWRARCLRGAKAPTPQTFITVLGQMGTLDLI
jgi:hypothetical protein